MPAYPLVAAYPHLDQLLGSYFHQDFDIFGNTLVEILHVYTEDTWPAEREATIADIHRFLANFGQTDVSLAVATEQIFKPGVILEGWEGLSTRQWFLEVARLLTAADA